MTTTRLTRPNQTWAVAYQNAFANPAAPTAAELNSSRFVHLLSGALTEDKTVLTLGNSTLDSTVVFTDIGKVENPTFNSISADLTWVVDANTGGSGTTVDLTSLYNKASALLGYADVNYWVISRTGPNASQDIPFAIGQVIKMALFVTDLPVTDMQENKTIRKTQTPIYQGQSIWNYTIAA